MEPLHHNSTTKRHHFISTSTPKSCPILSVIDACFFYTFLAPGPGFVFTTLSSPAYERLLTISMLMMYPFGMSRADFPLLLMLKLVLRSL